MQLSFEAHFSKRGLLIGLNFLQGRRRSRINDVNSPDCRTGWTLLDPYQRKVILLRNFACQGEQGFL